MKPAPRFTRANPEARRQMLVEAARRCLSKGGIAAFTVDQICKEAGVSRGLINHYFPNKDDLLVEIYQDSLYKTVNSQIAEARRHDEGDGPPEFLLKAIVEANFAQDYFARENLLVWLTLWGEIATNAKLRSAHRLLYESYRKTLAGAIERVAGARARHVDSAALARAFIALVDGLWLEWCLDPRAVSTDAARESCYDLLEAKLGSLR
ncbi:MAG: TetR family transcriptional regulator C-terminal domain-containing protein [Hyphomicrobiales bacterium]